MTAPTMTTEQALELLSLMASHFAFNDNIPVSKEIEAALDTLRQALTERDRTIANQALAYANLDTAVDSLEVMVRDRGAEIARLRAIETAAKEAAAHFDHLLDIGALDSRKDGSYVEALREALGAKSA